MAFHTRPTEAYIKGLLGTDDAKPVTIISADALSSASHADLYYVAETLSALILQNSNDMDVAWLVLCGTFGVHQQHPVLYCPFL